VKLNPKFFELKKAYYQGREDGYNNISEIDYKEKLRKLRSEDDEVSQCYSRGYKYGVSAIAEKEFHELSPERMYENLLKLGFRERIKKWSMTFEYFKKRYSIYYGKMKYLEITDNKTEEDYVNVAKIYIELRYLYEKLTSKEYEAKEGIPSGL